MDYVILGMAAFALFYFVWLSIIAPDFAFVFKYRYYNFGPGVEFWWGVRLRRPAILVLILGQLVITFGWHRA